MLAVRDAARDIGHPVWIFIAIKYRFTFPGIAERERSMENDTEQEIQMESGKC